MWNRDSPVSVVSLHWWHRRDWSFLWPSLRGASSPTITRPSYRQCDNPTWSHTSLLSRFNASCRSPFWLHNWRVGCWGGALWRASNLTLFSPCLTGAVDYPFASHHKYFIEKKDWKKLSGLSGSHEFVSMFTSIVLGLQPILSFCFHEIATLRSCLFPHCASYPETPYKLYIFINLCALLILLSPREGYFGVQWRIFSSSHGDIKPTLRYFRLLLNKQTSKKIS